MSRATFDDACEGCRPAAMMLDGRPAPAEVTRALDFVWSLMTPDERAAFHRFSCLNSRAPGDLAIVARLREATGRALKAGQS